MPRDNAMTALVPIRFLVVSLLLLTGCAGVFEPSDEWAEFEPPHEYRAWHREVEACVGARRAFEDIVWREVYARLFFCGGFDALGCYAAPRTIYLVEHALHAELVVKAEIVHYVRRNGLHDDLAKQCEGAHP